MVKNWPNNDKIVLGKHKIFTKALAKINFENHKELSMNEVHVTTAKVVLISLISGAAVALLGVSTEFGPYRAVSTFV